MNYKKNFFCTSLLVITCTQSAVGMKNPLPKKMSSKRATECLFKVCQKGYDVKKIEFLITQGASVNAEFDKKIRPLHVACVFGYMEIVQFLIKNGADINAKDNSSLTPLHCAAIAGQKIVVKHLLDAGADPDVVTSFGRTTFKRACHEKKNEIIELFPDQSGEGCFDLNTKVSRYKLM